MVTRVATGYQNQTALQRLQESNSALSQTTYQITTGYKSDELSDFSENAYSLLSLYDMQSNTQMYLSNITTATNRLNSTESALRNMSEILEDAASLWTLGRTENSPETRASLAEEAESLTLSFYNLLNTKFDGRYTFSGQNGAEAPTNDVATSTAFPGSPVPTTYYNGDSTLATIISGAGLTTSYGVSGDEEGIANLKAGLEALWYGLENDDNTEIDSAVAALEQAQTQISSLISTVGGQLDSLAQLETQHTNNLSFLGEQADYLDKVDVSEAITQFSQQEATLQAAMMVITQISQLSLLNYL